jgi:hypothetical protein
VAHVGRGSGNAEWLWAVALRTLHPARLRDLAAPETEKHLGSARISREGGSGTHWLLTAESRRACSAPASARGAKDGAQSGKDEQRLIPSRPPGLAADPAYSSGDSSGSRPTPADASLRRLSPHFPQCGPARCQGRGMAGAHDGDPCRDASRGLRRGEQARPLRSPLSAWRGLPPDDAPPPQRLPTRARWRGQTILRGARTALVQAVEAPVGYSTGALSSTGRKKWSWIRNAQGLGNLWRRSALQVQRSRVLRLMQQCTPAIEGVRDHACVRGVSDWASARPRGTT